MKKCDGKVKHDGSNNQYAKLYKDGCEVPDPRPIAIPVGFKSPESIAQTVARLVKNIDIQRELRRQGRETFEEANDFDIPGEELDPKSKWEEDYEGAFDDEIKLEKRLQEIEAEKTQLLKKAKEAKNGINKLDNQISNNDSGVLKGKPVPEGSNQ